MIGTRQTYPVLASLKTSTTIAPQLMTNGVILKAENTIFLVMDPLEHPQETMEII